MPSGRVSTRVGPRCAPAGIPAGSSSPNKLSSASRGGPVALPPPLLCPLFEHVPSGYFLLIQSTQRFDLVLRQRLIILITASSEFFLRLPLLTRPCNPPVFPCARPQSTSRSPGYYFILKLTSQSSLFTCEGSKPKTESLSAHEVTRRTRPTRPY